MDNVTQSPVRHGAMRLATVKLIEVMSKGSPGEVLTDERTSVISGHDTHVGGNGYGYLCSAIRYCLREHGVVWRRVRGEARIECLSDDQKIDLADWERRGINRRTRRSMRTLGSVDPSRLSDEKRKEHLVLAAVCGTLLETSSPRTIKRLGGDGTPKALDMSRLLTAMTQTE